MNSHIRYYKNLIHDAVNAADKIKKRNENREKRFNSLTSPSVDDEIKYLINQRNGLIREANLYKKVGKLNKELTAIYNEELKVLDIKNEQELKRLGWWGITDDELKWLMDNKEELCKFFLPSLQSVREQYAKAKNKQVTVDARFNDNPEMQIPNAWINPAGKYFPVEGFAQHNSWANEYLIKKIGEKGLKEKLNQRGKIEAFEYLENAGWIRLMKWPKMDVEFILPEKLTHAQKRTLDKYCTIYGWPLPFKDPLFN